MFLIDTQNKKTVSFEKKSFSDPKLSERYDLQEWIANNPLILGEDLLIIQKEFDGFPDTNERLDLLALDEVGKLVIIENKLNDSGKDVVWQAVKLGMDFGKRRCLYCVLRQAFTTMFLPERITGLQIILQL